MKWTTKTKVLIVDNNPADYSLGCQQTFISDSKKALALMDLTRATDLPIIVLADMAVSGTGGFEFARQFQARFGHLKIPLILTATVEFSEDLQEAITAGADGLIKKPVTKEKVLKFLDDRKERISQQTRKKQNFNVSFT